MLGVQYSSCCYAIQVRRLRAKPNGWDNDKQHAVYDNAIGFNIELRGLSSNYGLGTQELLFEHSAVSKHFVICCWILPRNCSVLALKWKKV